MSGDDNLRQALRRHRRRIPTPEGLPGELCCRLEAGLILCMPRNYITLFIDNRIAAWQTTLPDDSGPTIDQVRSLIDTLFTRHNDRGENALWLFLTVLTERTSPSDACYRHLCLLATDLHHTLEGRPK